MKLSQLISVLEDIKKEYGDKHIWSIDDMDCPCPRSFTIDLTSKLNRTDHGFSGGKSHEHNEIEVCLEYEDGVDVQDISLWDRNE